MMHVTPRFSGTFTYNGNYKYHSRCEQDGLSYPVSDDFFRKQAEFPQQGLLKTLIEQVTAQPKVQSAFLKCVERSTGSSMTNTLTISSATGHVFNREFRDFQAQDVFADALEFVGQVSKRP